MIRRPNRVFRCAEMRAHTTADTAGLRRRPPGGGGLGAGNVTKNPSREHPQGEEPPVGGELSAATTGAKSAENVAHQAHEAAKKLHADADAVHKRATELRKRATSQREEAQRIRRESSQPEGDS